MLRLFCGVFLSLTVLQILHCDVVNTTNKSVKNHDNPEILRTTVSSSKLHITTDNSNGTSSGNGTDFITLKLIQNSNKDSLGIINSSLDNTTKTNEREFDSNDKNLSSETVIEKQSRDEFDMDQSEKESLVNTDDIPTFVEYQQRIEKESKQKREKSDSIPNTPSLILKDKQTLKATTEQINLHAPSDQQDTQSSGSATKSQENKFDQETGHNSRKQDEQKTDVTTSILSKSLMKHNVAAKECGAKILEVSDQISHKSFVLNNNKDEYMNVPCKVPDKWFVLETCEPVQIRSIQIANFEMFSSRPKTFKVATADRYPVKIWHHLGIFRAHDEKGIQTFEVSDTRMVKYLKFEMIDHYGNEHYCPLTFVRVMGNVVIDDMDEDNDDDDQPVIGEKNPSPEELPQKTQSNGLLTKAKDMIAKIVNGIGGSQKEGSLTAGFQKNINIDESSYNDISVNESPCHFLEFSTNHYRHYFQNISIHFLRMYQLSKLITTWGTKSFQQTLYDQPHPSQIRVDYFTVVHTINTTEYSFDRLYQSFINVSRYCSEECFSLTSLRQLRHDFKCLYKDSPAISFSNDDSEEDLSAKVIIEHNVAGNLSVEQEAISSADIEDLNLWNHSGILAEDLQSAIKNKSEENLSDLSLGTKSPGTESIELPQPKYKSDDIFDNKMLSNPGNNAWNYAFMRIKNLAKELEVNVSISMTYLEELSQNYKQQTDRLKKAQVVMADNVTQIENMINQHRQETRASVKELRIQLQAIIVRMRLAQVDDKSKSMNLSSMDRVEDSDCIDILAEALILPTPSLFDSSVFVTLVNVTLSLLCNAILLALFYTKIRNSILKDVTTMVTSSNIVPSTIDEKICVPSRTTSMTDLRSEENTFPVVLPPRGVHIFNFPDCDYLSDDDNLPRIHKGFGPLFYPVQPSVNFVTPTKDKKKKRKK